MREALGDARGKPVYMLWKIVDNGGGNIGVLDWRGLEQAICWLVTPNVGANRTPTAGWLGPG